MSIGNRGGASAPKLAQQQDAASQGEAGQQTPTDNQADTGDDKAQIALVPDLPAIETTSTQTQTERQEQRADADLQAQQDMALYALLMLIATVATVVITGFGVWLVKRTLDATLQAVKDTGEATAAMVEANDIAREAQRPWLNFKIVEIGRPSGLALAQKAIRVKLQITNHSNKPAHSVCAAGIADGRRIGLLVMQANEIPLSERVKSKLQDLIKSQRGMVVFPQESRKTSVICDILGISKDMSPKDRGTCALTVGICYQFDGKIGYTVRTYYVSSLWDFMFNEEIPRLPPAIIDDNVKTEAT